ncbi:uncharacterized protein LOC126820632 [Patella vulgata]|uniref:uncharacterized protein LOC126820632 n=1 Tax=Patella vulgata TaxID=6465 RepID=UPI00217F9F13|nr:uncharacterized protein LOC126820632 [Patella vulgata]
MAEANVDDTDLQSENEGNSDSQRERKLTQKGLEYQIQQKQNSFRRAVSKWRQQANTLGKLLSDSRDIPLIRKERDTLENVIGEISYILSELNELCEEGREVEAYYERYDNIEEDHCNLLKKVSSYLHDFLSDRGSRSSSKSKQSSKSSSSRKADILVEAAELKVKLKYVEIEARKKAELEKLRIEKELCVAEAKVNAIVKVEEEDRYELPEETVTNFVENFVISSTDPYINPLTTPASTLSSSLNPNVPEFQAIYASSSSHTTHVSPSHINTQPIASSSTNLVSDNPPPVNYPYRSNSNDSQSDLLALSKLLTEQSHLNRLPPPEPSVFSGDPLKYPSWKCAFETLIENRNIPVSQRMHYLWKYLGGPARDAVESYFLLNTDGAFQDAKNLLEKRFGHPFVIANAFRNKLDSWPKIPPRDGIELRKFADFLRQCEIAMSTINSLQILNDSHENKKLLSKIPEWLVSRWARMVYDWQEEKNRFPPFSLFVRFIAKEADIACDPVTTLPTFRKDTYNRYNPSKSSKSISLATEVKENHLESTQSKLWKKQECFLCKGPHNIDVCKSFLDKSLPERKEYSAQNGLCFGCLSLGHRSKFCRSRLFCNICSKGHPTSLHGDSGKPVPYSEAENTKPKSVLSHNTSIKESVSKSSTTVLVWLSHRDNPEIEILTYAMLDTQSDSTWVTNSSYNKLNIDSHDVVLSLSTMFAKDQVINSRKVSGLMVRGYDNLLKIPLPSVYTRESIPVNRSHIPTPEMARQWPHLVKISDELVPLKDVDAGLLIGYDCARALAPREVIPPVGDGPFAQRTDLGWGIVGVIDPSPSDIDFIGVSHTTLAYPVPSVTTNSSTPDHVYISLRSEVNEIIDLNNLQRMFEIDFIENKSDQTSYSREEKKFLDLMSDKIHVTADGHYEMPLPFKNGDPVLPNNKAFALNRLSQLKNRLQKNPQHLEDYIDFMKNLIDKGYAEIVPDTEQQGDRSNIWYIPHHAVYNPNKPGQVRVVFGCNAEFRGHSLNDCLLKGPDLTNTLIGVLCRFRLDRVAFMCDIEKMFYQFRVNVEHRD